MRFMCAIILVVGLALPAQAADDGKGWSFFGRFSGSSNSDGLVTKAESGLGYSFNNHWSTYTGVPFYFVNRSSSTTTTTSGSMSGVGNAFLGFCFGTKSDLLNYTSNLKFTAPTSDKSRGFSTDRVTTASTNTSSN